MRRFPCNQRHNTLQLITKHSATKVVQNLTIVKVGHYFLDPVGRYFMFLRRKESPAKHLLRTFAMWAFQFRSLSTMTPRY